MPVKVAGYLGEHAVPPLEGGLVGDAARLGRALDGDVVAHESDEGDPDGGGGFRQCSRTVPVGEVNLLPQERQRHSGTPAAVDPSLQAPAAPHAGYPGTASLSRRSSSAVRPATSAPKGFALPISICPIRPSAHPEGLSPNKDSGGCSCKFSVWLGRAWHSGTLRPPNYHLLSKLLESGIKC